MKLGFIGIGSMGGMLARALLRSGAVEPESVWVANRSPQRVLKFITDWRGVRGANNEVVARSVDVLFLGVHTGDVLPVLDRLKGALRKDQVLVVMANLVPLKVVAAKVPCAVAKVIPSITQRANGGVSLVMFSETMTTLDRERLTALLSRIGEVKVIPEELGRACADLTSAGPAFIASVLQEMAAAAVACDPRLDAKQAWEMLVSTASGTVDLLREMDPEKVIKRVATPGGMTEAGLEVLRQTLPEMWRDIFRRMKAREDASRARLGL
jgi:pyrroline-5-carboxylate reductase